MSKEIGITVKKNENISEWYTQVVLKSELADYATMKGFMVLRPYGYSIWEKIREIIDSRIKETGHTNAYFPALIPESFLRKEAQHFSGFVPEVFWVTHAGENRLSERLALRPTSETIIYDSFSRWIRSWRDLPVLLNVWNSVLRAEIKATKPFMRTSEFLWQEGHTAHATQEEAEREVLLILGIYRELAERYLAIPVLTGTKTDREKFVGAVYTTTLEAMMPDGRALQLGTSHGLGQNFSKPFEITYIGKDEKHHHPWTTSWGISWRLIGAVILVHSDDRGLILPPKIAPLQTVIVPIFYEKTENERVIKKTKRIAEKLKGKGLTVHIDDRTEYTPGWKFHEWELKGIPIRIEVGPRDVKSRQVTVQRRDTLERKTLPDASIPRAILRLMDDIQNNLYSRAVSNLKEQISSADSYNEFKQLLEERGGFVKSCWCSNVECEDKIKQETGATIRLVPFDKEPVSGSCVYCGGAADKAVYFAKAY